MSELGLPKHGDTFDYSHVYHQIKWSKNAQPALAFEWLTATSGAVF